MRLVPANQFDAVWARAGESKVWAGQGKQPAADGVTALKHKQSKTVFAAVRRHPLQAVSASVVSATAWLTCIDSASTFDTEP